MEEKKVLKLNKGKCLLSCWTNLGTCPETKWGHSTGYQWVTNWEFISSQCFKMSWYLHLRG